MPEETDTHQHSSQATETPHVHEKVKDIDELIAAMDNVDEGMPEDDEESEEDSDEESSESPGVKASAPKEKKEDVPVIEDSEEVKKAKERLAQIKGKYLTLRWDVEHGQINPAKKAQFEKIKPEYEALVKVIEASGQKA